MSSAWQFPAQSLSGRFPPVFRRLRRETGYALAFGQPAKPWLAFAGDGEASFRELFMSGEMPRDSFSGRCCEPLPRASGSECIWPQSTRCLRLFR